jgi:3-oxoacyl-[acyl-carrier protein] reductase
VTSARSPFRLDDDVALITGGTGGLGAPICRAFAAAGASVVVHHLNDTDRADALVAELAQDGTRAFAVGGDLTDEAAVEQMFHQITEQFGSCTVVVNNAGMMEEQSFADMSLPQWNRTIAADLTAPMLVSRRFARQPAAHGAIVNVSSQLAMKGAHNFVAYSAAKAGVLGLTRALARELGPRIRVNAIAPGPVMTPLIDDLARDPDWVRERTQGAVTGKLAHPDEVAPTVVFLASAAATLLHGQTLHVNGGGVMQ